ncbi:AAR2-like protein [Cryptotermes secundus]|uniref:Protein AAR2 homolog n=1 Tax=Cryptotermes secundus TaxID=105785 RepID=A0A2J7QZV1_9NEOP|nr:protein AAR2 homolog [Cryptotermes secundus]PNF34112.1 AAR2-like protein [Cryptotermes secundus]
MSDSLDIDQRLARQLLLEGATLVFLDVPRGTEFGIDMKSWNTGDKFKGVKMIPPGPHYVYYNAVNSEGDTAPRVGFVHNFKKSEFMVKKWDPAIEDISTTELSEEEISRIRGDLLNLDRFLGPYPFDIWKRWKDLTSKVTDELISRLVPELGQIRSALELVSCDKSYGDVPAPKRRSRPLTAEEREEDLLPQLKPTPGTELRFTQFPERNFPEGSTPAEITHHSLDSTYVLETMLAKYKRPIDIVGELQFAFVCFLIGQSLEAFEHWKQLVKLLCSCDDAVSKRREVYDEFLSALGAQLVEIQEDFLVDIVASNNFVYRSLLTLFRTLHLSETVDGRLKSKAKRFQERLTLKFMWDFTGLDKDDDDEAPVVVNI